MLVGTPPQKNIVKQQPSLKPFDLDFLNHVLADCRLFFLSGFCFDLRKMFILNLLILRNFCYFDLKKTFHTTS